MIKKPRPLFIAVEGGDATGKTTIVEHIYQFFTKLEVPVVKQAVLRCGDIGKAVTKQVVVEPDVKQPTPACVATWLASAHLECYHDRVLANIDAGFTVVLDRFLPSYYAYQVMADRNPFAKKIFNHVLEDELFIAPDITFHLESSIPVVMERLASRRVSDNYEMRPAEYHKNVVDGYRRFFNTRSGWNKAHVNTDAPLDEVKKCIDDVLNLELLSTNVRIAHNRSLF